MRRSALALLLGCLLLVAGVSAIDGYDYYQTIEYAACDQETYQQDIVIHRSTGTAYNETAGGLETWHIYVGEHCREDYGDVRFTNSTGDLAYYLWPDYNSTYARFAVRLEGAASAGALSVWYGNPTATTTSDKAATFLFSEEFPTGALNTDRWTEDAVGSITDTRTGDGMDNITGGTVSGSSYWMYDITDSANQHQAKVVLPASYILEWENTVSTLSANQMGQGGVGLVSDTNKIVAFAGHGDWAGDSFAVLREIIHETGSLVRYNGYTQGGSAYHTKKAASSETKIPYKIRVANNDVAVTINNQLACTFTKTTAISKLAILAGTYGGYPFVTYIGISNLRVRAYSATPPAALAFSGEQEFSGVRPFPGLTLIPRDLAGTGLYTDINGNNRLDYNDLIVFFQHLAWAKTAQPTACFDFNGNGWLDYNDVITLFTTISGGV